jgi:hypothetical protein
VKSSIVEVTYMTKIPPRQPVDRRVGPAITGNLSPGKNSSTSSCSESEELTI